MPSVLHDYLSRNENQMHYLMDTVEMWEGVDMPGWLLLPPAKMRRDMAHTSP